MTEQRLTEALASIRRDASEQRRWNEWVHGPEHTIRRAMSLVALSEIASNASQIHDAQLTKEVAA